MEDCLELPGTGFETWSLALLGLGAIIVGVLLWRLGRRGLGAAAALVMVLAFATSSHTPVFADDDCIPVPVAPVAVDDTAIVESGASVTIAVLANDTGDGPGIVATTNPANGTIFVDAIGTITYTSWASFDGVDTFGYSIKDAHGNTANATVTVNVVFPITVEPLMFEFGNVEVDEASAPQSLVFTNISDSTLDVHIAGGAPWDGVNFDADAYCVGSPTTILAGDSCDFRYTFTPRATGEFTSGSGVTVTVGPADRSFTIGLHGWGVAPSP